VNKDIDEESLKYATSNIARNHLSSRIRPFLNTKDAPLIPLVDLEVES
jgi:hypothetical protein